MARVVVTPTDTYALLSGTAVMITIKKAGTGVLFLNDVNTDDDAALQISKATPGAKDSLQVSQNLIKNTYVKTSGEGWILVKEEG